MAVTNGEEVTMFQTHNVWRCNIRILICFIGIMSRNTTLRSKWEFGYNVANFVWFWKWLLGCRFLRIVIFSVFGSILRLLCQLLLLSKLLGSSLNSLQSLALPKTMNSKALQRLSSLVARALRLDGIKSCHDLRVMAFRLSTCRSWSSDQLFFHCTLFQWRTLFTTIICSIDLCLLAKALISNISKHLRGFNHPSSATCSWWSSIGFSRILSLSDLILHEII